MWVWRKGDIVQKNTTTAWHKLKERSAKEESARFSINFENKYAYSYSSDMENSNLLDFVSIPGSGRSISSEFQSLFKIERFFRRFAIYVEDSGQKSCGSP